MQVLRVDAGKGVLQQRGADAAIALHGVHADEGEMPVRLDEDVDAPISSTIRCASKRTGSTSVSVINVPSASSSGVHRGW